MTSLDHGNVRKTQRAVMTDVAKLAGVSHQTVSRVINGSDRVSAETRERVLAAMTKLDYRPNRAARALVTGRSRTLGIITMDTALYGPTSALLAIERAAHHAGYAVSITSLQGQDAESLQICAETLRGQAVEAILVIAPQRHVALAVMQLPGDIPVVAVEAGPKDGASVVEVDQFAGARLATQHLLDLGHRTVWHIAGPEDWLEAEDRVAGWRAALAENGAPIPEPLIGDWSARSGYQLAEQLVADAGVTAVFVANDTMALGLLRRLHEVRRPVPESISVVGFDNAPEAAYYTPALTTVRQNFTELGRRSFELALSAIEGKANFPTRLTVPAELMVRGSTAPPP